MVKPAKTAISACFAIAAAGMASAGAYAACCSDPLNDDPSSLTFRSFGSADVALPTSNQRPLPDNSGVRFEISTEDIPLNYLFSSTMALYGKGRRPADNQACPFMDTPESYRSYSISGNTVYVEMKVSRALAETVQKYGCVITPTVK